MEWKADYSIGYSFKQAIAEPIGIKWIMYSGKKKDFEDECDIIQFNDYGNIFDTKGSVISNDFKYMTNHSWFKVYEFKEEPKKEPELMTAFRNAEPELLEIIEKERTKRNDEIRSICREEIKKQNNILSGEFVGFDKNILQFSDGTRYQFNKELWDKQIDKWSLIKGYKDVKDNAENYIKKSMFANNPKFMKDWINGSWENGKEEAEKAIKQDKVKCRNANKKPKQEFDGEKKIYISDKDNDFKYLSVVSINTSNKYMEQIGYRLATQSEINQFFKGIKKRKEKRNLDEYYLDTKTGNWCPKATPQKRYNYAKYETSDKPIYLKYWNHNGISGQEFIPEAEYLEGLK